jgi:anti-sigma factor RsiW
MSGGNVNDHRTERLSDFLDGALEPRERDAVERHLAECDACAATLEQLREVRSRAAALAPIPPDRDLWSAIEARLDQPEPRREVVDLAAERARRARRLSFTLPQLAAAAAALVVVTAAGTWSAFRVTLASRGAPATSVASGPAAAIGTPDEDAAGPSGAAAPAGAARSASRRIPADAASATVARFDSRPYDLAIADLERALAENRDRLNPATVKVLEKNIALIDSAIVDARRALAADPASLYLNNHLAATMKRKVELLRQVAAALRT